MVPKFRAWDKRENTMRDVAVLHFTKGGKVNSIEYWKTPSELKSYHVRNLVIMQSTRLKDKNGVEIFEGDIVAIKYSESGYHYYEKIVFENGTFTAGDEDWLYNIKDYCVVCGNIYENPELLEPANEN